MIDIKDIWEHIEKKHKTHCENCFKEFLFGNDINKILAAQANISASAQNVSVKR